MSVQSATSRIQYVGNNSTVTEYVVTFFFGLSSDLKVVVTDEDGAETLLTETTDYVVSGAGDENGGDIVTVAAVPATSTVTIYREVPATQLTTYAENDAFPASSHESALDKLTYLVQQIARGIARCLRVTEASDQPDDAVSVPLSVAGLDGSGNLVFRTVDEMISFLSLSGALSDFPGATWADDAERAAKVPDFLGQLGTQRDTKALYVSTGVVAGDWAAATISGLTNAQVAANAAIAFSKLATLASGNILVGSAGGVATSVAMSGDATIVASGALTVAANAITTAKILDANVTSAKLAAGASTANLSVGSILQVVTAELTTFTSTGVSIPKDDTIPQIGEGAALPLSASITPASASNTVRVRLTVPCLDNASGGETTFAVFRNAVANAVAAGSTQNPAAQPTDFSLEFVDSPATVSAVTYAVRFGSSSGTSYVNGINSGRLFGGVSKTTLSLEEIKA